MRHEGERFNLVFEEFEICLAWIYDPQRGEFRPFPMEVQIRWY